MTDNYHPSSTLTSTIQLSSSCNKTSQKLLRLNAVSVLGKTIAVSGWHDSNFDFQPTRYGTEEDNGR